MNLFTAIIYYIGIFAFTMVFILAGCFSGAALRKRKDAKLAMNNNDNTSEQ